MNKTAEKTPAPPHDLILEGRSKLTVTGVKRVLRCDADSAAMETGKGVLHLTPLAIRWRVRALTPSTEMWPSLS